MLLTGSPSPLQDGGRISRFAAANAVSNAPFTPDGVGRFSAGSEGVVLLRSVTTRISTADSTLMVGRGLSRPVIATAAVSIVIS